MSLFTTILNAKEPEQLIKASQILINEGLVAFPTETVYGLGALGLNETAVKRIFKAKNRPAHNPLILHVQSKTEALKLFDFTKCENPKQTKQYFEKLTALFWPGPLTLVCLKKEHVPNIVTAGLNKVAVRVPNHPIALRLLELVKEPIAAPSANASTRPSATTALHVKQTLDGKVDAILDDGPCFHGLESTVVDISSNPPVLLRTGAIPLEKLLKVIPEITWREIGIETHDSSGSPGLSSKHYAPHINQIELVETSHLQNHWLSTAALLLRESTAQKLENDLGARPKNAAPLKMLSDNWVEYAQKLYSAFYELEQADCHQLIIEKIPIEKNTDLSLSILDRLIRATTKSIH